MKTERMISKMISFYSGNVSDIHHFIKVHAFAHVIGVLENLDEKTQETLEYAAIVHDIACPLCRRKYGSTEGSLQEKESEPLLREFLAEYGLANDMLERIIFLVTHHHTYTGVDGPDYQILLEADYLVNCGESEKYRRRINEFRNNVFKTKTGICFLNAEIEAKN